MVCYCCVKGCNSNSNTKKKDPTSLLSFHAFPSNIELKTKWLKAIGRPNWTPPTHARICSLHFDHAHINYEGCRVRIKDDTIPTSNLPPNSNFEATDVEACRICLATDIKLYSLQDSQLSSYMDSIVGFSENQNIEGLPQYVCYLCAASLSRSYKLVEKNKIAQATLLDIFATHGQITKYLIKQQNRDKINLTSSLSCCIMKNENYFYKYNDEISDNFINNVVNIKDVNLKNENIDNDVNIKADIVIEKQECEVELNENKSDYDDNNLGDSPVEYLNEEYNNMSENVKNIVKQHTVKPKKRLTVKEKKPVRKKQTGKKYKDLTPDEIDMLKYFDVVKLTLQEQIEEWKRTVAKRLLISETVYECEVCSKMFAHINTYRGHISCHDVSRGQVECPVCKLRFKNDVLARSHCNRVHAKKFHCKSCPKVFHNVGVAKKHQRWHLGYMYSCAWCTFRSAHESALGAHVRRAHARHVCALCARACRTRAGLALHVSHAHRQLQETDSTKTYPCESCNINFTSEGARRVHLLTSSQHRKTLEANDPVSENLRNSCNKCGLKCTSLSELVTHTRAEHPRAKRRQWKSHDSYPTQCQLCGETVTCRKKHWQHVRKQHPKETNTYRPVVTAVCDTCGKGFQNSTKLHLHKLRHSAPTVSCDSCQRMFYDKYALARHVTTHRTNKPHDCATCGRAFKLRSNLERHFRVHTDITPYECTMCAKKFKYSSSVNLHIRTVHYKLPHPPRKKRNKIIKEADNCVNDIDCTHSN